MESKMNTEQEVKKNDLGYFEVAKDSVVKEVKPFTNKLKDRYDKLKKYPGNQEGHKSDVGRTATTRHLTKIITVLGEVESLNLTRLVDATGISDVVMRDALNWLCNHKIVKKFQTMKKEQNGLVHYKLYPKCCLCGDDYGEFGNNPRPLAEGRCCDKCNNEKVIPARINIAVESERQEEFCN